MGAAAYNRGTKRIAADIEATLNSAARRCISSIDDFNAIKKYPDAATPFGPIVLQFDWERKYWWAMDAEKRERGYSVPHSDLREAMKRLNVTLTGFNQIRWEFTAIPRSAS